MLRCPAFSRGAQRIAFLSNSSKFSASFIAVFFLPVRGGESGPAPLRLFCPAFNQFAQVIDKLHHLRSRALSPSSSFCWQPGLAGFGRSSSLPWTGRFRRDQPSQKTGADDQGFRRRRICRELESIRSPCRTRQSRAGYEEHEVCRGKKKRRMANDHAPSEEGEAASRLLLC